MVGWETPRELTYTDYAHDILRVNTSNDRITAFSVNSSVSVQIRNADLPLLIAQLQQAANKEANR